MKIKLLSLQIPLNRYSVGASLLGLLAAILIFTTDVQVPWSWEERFWGGEPVATNLSTDIHNDFDWGGFLTTKPNESLLDDGLVISHVIPVDQLIILRLDQEKLDYFGSFPVAPPVPDGYDAELVGQWEEYFENVRNHMQPHIEALPRASWEKLSEEQQQTLEALEEQRKFVLKNMNPLDGSLDGVEVELLSELITQLNLLHAVLFDVKDMYDMKGN